MKNLFHRIQRDDLVQRCINMAVLVDIVAAVIALAGAHALRFKLLPNAVLTQNHLVTGLLILSGVLLDLLLLLMLGAYRQRSLLRFRRCIPVILKASSLWLLIFPAVTLFLKFLPNISRVFILLGFFLLIIVNLLARFLYFRLIHALGYTAAFRQRVLLVDWTPKIAQLAKSINLDLWHPYEIVGIAPMEGDKFSTPPDVSLPILGSHKEIETVLQNGLVQILIMGDGHLRTDEAIASLSALCEKYLVTFMMIPKAFQILLSSLHVTTVSSIPVMGISELPLESPLNAMIKRVTDLIGAVAGLIAFSPFLVIFPILVYLESPGPVFYRQRRIGRGGREFEIIKIRSMKLDAEKESGARWASKDDDRRLRIGAFMRRWNIDELPQFWNVLKGEMSLVGPRPERPELIDGFKETIRNYNARHHVVPGVTGWAQVNGLRGDTDLSERVRYDLYYMENWSLALDIQIMLMTFFRWEGAA
jgi:exopolysaccharide biosynthesis polyprenyl glycosylphosphotransferase